MQTHPPKPELTLTGIMISDAENKGITAYFAEFPEVIAQGDNIEDAKGNLLDAFRFMLEFKQSEIEDDEDGDSNITKQSFNLSIS
jgi:predicted RNase H-like HicB family nuclease